MENLWIFYSLAGLIVLWLGDFIKKVVLQRKWDKEVFLFMCFVFYIIILWWNYLINSNTEITAIDIKSALIIGSFDFLAPLWTLTALKYLDVSFSLVTIRLISSILILIIWMNLLWDSLSFYNLLGFLIWFMAIFSLSGFSFSKKISLHWKWLLAIFLCIIGIVGSHSYFKYVVADLDINNFMIIKFSITFSILIFYMFIRKKFKNFSYKQLKIVMPYALVSGIIFSAMFLFIYPKIYLLWPLSLWYKILSYSLIVPIILSMIIYKDKITKRKAIAFALTMISLALFIV